MRIIALKDLEFEKLYKELLKQLGTEKGIVRADRRLINLLESAFSVDDDRYKRWLDTS